METLVIAAAVVIAAALLTAGGRREPSRHVGRLRLSAPAAISHHGNGEPLTLAAVVPGQPTVRVFARPGIPRVDDGQDGAPASYTLAVARNSYGHWTPALSGPIADDGQRGVLTLTLVVPWSDLAKSYSAVDLVLR